MSPKSRGRPPARRKKQSGRRSASRGGAPLRLVPAEQGAVDLPGEETDCWFDDPRPDDRRSWAMPAGHGTYRGLELEHLDPADEDELGLLLEARHPDYADALESGAEMTSPDGEPFSPRLHVTVHQVVARQLLADEPAETWHTVQRLARMGYDWHNIMHMIAGLVTEDIHRMMAEHQEYDAASYVRRLNALPGDWPAPEELEP